MSISENSGITAIRTVKILRPLRAINRIPSVRILVTIIIDTLPMLGNVMLLGLLIFTVFGIIGVQLWQGLLRNRCFTTPALHHSISSNLTNASAVMASTSSLFYQPVDSDFICSTSGGMTKCEDIPAQDDMHAKYAFCRPSGRNPFKGAISFDNIGYAFIVIFQVDMTAAVSVDGRGWLDEAL